VIIAVDTREQQPYRFKQFSPPLVRTTLQTGDYSVIGFENMIAVERKNPADFIQSIGRSRERFFDEIGRLSLVPYSIVVVESTIIRMMTSWFNRTGLSESQVTGAIVAIVSKFRTPVIMTETKASSEEFVYKYLKSSMTAIRTYDKWGSAFDKRHVATFTCQGCGITKHEDIERIHDWRTANGESFDCIPFVLCPRCYTNKTSTPQDGYKWRRKR